MPKYKMDGFPSYFHSGLTPPTSRIVEKKRFKESRVHEAILPPVDDFEECVVQYEPWMDDHGNRPKGIQFDENDDICKEHPEVWLDPEEDQDVFFK